MPCLAILFLFCGSHKNIDKVTYSTMYSVKKASKRAIYIINISAEFPQCLSVYFLVLFDALKTHLTIEAYCFSCCLLAFMGPFKPDASSQIRVLAWQIALTIRLYSCKQFAQHCHVFNNMFS